MKSLLKKITILTILLATITSCDDVKDLADIEINGNVITEYFTVNLDGAGSIDAEDFTVSILTDEIKPYADKIKDVEIQKITFEILDYTGDAAAEFTVKFTADGTLFIDESFIGSEASANGTIFEVSDTQALNTLATSLLNNNMVTVSLNASSENLEGPAYFKIETKFYIDVTVNPL